MKDPVRESTADREAYNLSFIRSDEGLKQILDELDDLYEGSSVRNPYFSPDMDLHAFRDSLSTKWCTLICINEDF